VYCLSYSNLSCFSFPPLGIARRHKRHAPYGILSINLNLVSSSCYSFFFNLISFFCYEIPSGIPRILIPLVQEPAPMAQGDNSILKEFRNPAGGPYERRAPLTSCPSPQELLRKARGKKRRAMGS